MEISTQFIALLAITIMLIITIRLNFYRSIFKRIMFEDRMDTHLNKPLLVKDYIKLFKNEFRPYPMSFTTDINGDIYDKFVNFYKDIELLKYKQPSHLHIVFVDKVDGYIHNDQDDTYELIIKDDFLPFVTDDKEQINIVDTLLNQEYSKIEEFNLKGTIIINNKEYLLNNLTSISSFKNTIKGKSYSELVFNFGLTTESVRFDSFEDSFMYLFNNDKSDIRLIEKIANASLINIENGVNV